MLSNIWEDGIEYFVALLTGLMDKISMVSVYAFSPQLLLFNTNFGGIIPTIYNIFIDVAFVIAILLFLSKLVIGIVNPNDRSYESPFLLIKGFVKFLVILWLVPTILSFTLSLANTSYWGVVEGISSEAHEDTVKSMGMWSRLQQYLANNEPESEPVESEEEVTETGGTSTYVTPSDRVSGGLMSAVFSLILVILLFKEYIVFLLEMAERYVLVGVLTFCAPLAIAPLVSNDTKQITKKFFSMWIGQLLVLIFSVVFLLIFQYGIISMADTAATSVEISTDGMAATKSVGGAYVFLMLMIGFLKIGQKMDTFLNNVGLTVGQTGQGTGFIAGMLATRTISAMGKAAGSAAGKLFGSASNPGSTLNKVLSTFGINPANPEDVTSKANTDVLQAVRDQYGTDEKAKFGNRGGEKFAEGLEGESVNSAMRQMDSKGWQDVSDEFKKGGYGLDGELAKGYAQSIYQSDSIDNDSKFAIPNGAEITGAKFDSDGNGVIDYTDENNNNHHLKVGDAGDGEHPSEGPDYQVQTDPNGNDHWVQDYGDAGLSDEMGKTGLPENYDVSATAAMPGLDSNDLQQTKEMFGVESGGSMYKDADGSYTIVDSAGNDVATNVKTQSAAEYSGGSENGVKYDNGNGTVVSGELATDGRPMRNVEGAFSVDPATGKMVTGNQFTFDSDFAKGHESKEQLKGTSVDDVRSMLNENKAGSVRFNAGEGALKVDQQGNVNAYDKYGNRAANNIHTATESEFLAAKAGENGKNIIGKKMADGNYVMAEKAAPEETKRAGYGLHFDEAEFHKSGIKQYRYEGIDKTGQKFSKNISYDDAQNILRTNHDQNHNRFEPSSSFKTSPVDNAAYAKNLDDAIKRGYLPAGENFERTARAMFNTSLKDYQIDLSNSKNGFSPDGNRMTVIARKIDSDGNAKGDYEKIEFIRGTSEAASGRYQKVTAATGEEWHKGSVAQRRPSTQSRPSQSQNRPTHSTREKTSIFEKVSNIKENKKRRK